MANVRVGTSGWNYPTGRGTWSGVFYPPPGRRSRGFDELQYYAEHFDTVEVNSTFYGQPRAEVTSDWSERTPAGFEFSVKLYQQFTHPKVFKKRLERSLPPETSIDVMEALTRPNQADLDQVQTRCRAAGGQRKARHAARAVPASFKHGEVERIYLADLLGAFADYPVAVELRHRSWSDRFSETLTLLNGFQAAWVQIDEPKCHFSIRQNYLPNVKGFYYMRLHGRNAPQWWRHEKSEDRYDYLYSEDELKEFVETTKAARELVKKIYLYTNNHFSAKSVANAVMIKKRLGEPLAGTSRPEFVKRYPALADIVTVGSSSIGRLL